MFGTQIIIVSTTYHADIQHPNHIVSQGWLRPQLHFNVTIEHWLLVIRPILGTLGLQCTTDKLKLQSFETLRLESIPCVSSSEWYCHYSKDDTPRSSFFHIKEGSLKIEYVPTCSITLICYRDHGGRVVTLLPPTSEIGVRFPARPQVGKLVVACRWSAVYSIEPWRTVCTGFLCPSNYPSWYDLYSVESDVKPQKINKI